MTQIAPDSINISLKRYILLFCGAYIVCLLLVVGITTILQFDIPSSMGIVTLMAALAMPIASFVKDTHRAFTKPERLRFATGVGTSVVAMNFALIALMKIVNFGPTMLDQVAADAGREGISLPLLFAGLALFAFVLSWIIAYFFSGFMSRQQVKQLAKTK
jgi:hypothetical protein